jgi:hypothetical protein
MIERNPALFDLGALPPTPRGLTHWDQSMGPAKAKGRTRKCGPHTSVTLPALGSLPSVALSSERVNAKYITKKLLAIIF